MLKSLNYSEYESSPRQWRILNATFSEINLITGKNSAGKSRLISVLLSLSRLLAGQVPTLFDSANFDAELVIDGSTFRYKLHCERAAVISERLEVDGVEKFTRDQEGRGKIFYESSNEFLEFKLPPDAIVAVNRRDEIQHSYLIKLHNWALGVAFYPFGSDFGKSRLMTPPEIENHLLNTSSPPILDDPGNLVGAYASAFSRFGEDFDRAIIADMQQLGYSITDVGAENIQSLVKFPISAYGIFAQESDLGFKNPQTQLSQGMFRALALVIHLNICLFAKSKKVILVDDIGEGLDYERATAVIDLLIAKTKNSGIQLFMTTNDRFVMNKVPLEYWSVLKRDGGEVKMYNIRSAPKEFENFRFLGLNNFDFFASNLFEPENKHD